jgi:hypothetical protein
LKHVNSVSQTQASWTQAAQVSDNINSGILEQFPSINTESICDSSDVVDGHVALSAFDPTEIGSVYPALVS